MRLHRRVAHVELTGDLGVREPSRDEPEHLELARTEGLEFCRPGIRGRTARELLDQAPGGGGTDKFRIKIWDKNAADAIVYDNADAGGDDIDSSSTQEIAGGSIVIHKGR